MDELTKRNQIISKARKKYIPDTTMNISEALGLYLKNNAPEEEQIPLRVSTKNRPKNWVDSMGRPDCPECSEPLMLSQRESKWVCRKCEFEKKMVAKFCPDCNTTMQLQPVNTSPKDQTGDDSKSVWICSSSKCMETIYNKETMREILRKGESNGLP